MNPYSIQVRNSFSFIIMELVQLFTSFTSTTCLFLITLCLFYFIKHNTNTSKSKKLPPGPWKLPIIGSLHHMLGSALPHQTLSKLAKKYGPIMHLQLGEMSAVVFSSPEVAKLALKTHDLAFADRPSTLATDVISYDKSNIGFAPYGDYWRQMRKICMLELLSSKRVKSYQSIRELEMEKLACSIRKSEGSPINLSAQLFRLSSSIVSTAVFGENIHDQGSEVDLGVVDELVSLIDGFNLDDFFPSLKILASLSGMKSKLQKVHKKVDTMLQEIIKKHQEEAMKQSGKGLKENEDILATLLKLQKQDEQAIPITITDNQVKAVAMDLLIAGSESSATVIEWAVSELIRNPEKMEKVQSEIRQIIDGNKNTDETEARELRYLNCVIKETLRLHPPAPVLVPRECREACVINGFNIPLKTKVIINVWAIGRDPKIWKDAEKFVPERFEENMIEFNGNDYEYLPFGSGRRMCPGLTFGLATVELALIRLLYHFNWKLPNNAKGESLDMTESAGLAAKRKIPLQLVASACE